MTPLSNNPKHPDAVGYLLDLANEIKEPWFKMVCDLVVENSVSEMDDTTFDTLIDLFTGKASYNGIYPPLPAPAAAVATTPADFLESLSHFGNFKLLSDSLAITFLKPVTLIFGTNSSGKSSLCESLKVLASSQQPVRPLQNVHTTGAASPTFRFKFRSDLGPQTWTPAAGYGLRKSTIKYFDTMIAIQNVSNEVDPGRVIVLSPFTLHLFEWAKSLTVAFRGKLQKIQQDKDERMTKAFATIRAEFVRFNRHPLAQIDIQTAGILFEEIKLGEDFTDQSLLAQMRSSTNEVERATSAEGLKLINAECRELESFLNSANLLLTSAADLWALEPVKKGKILAEKLSAQILLSKTLIPEGATLEEMLCLVRAAFPLCKMDDAAGCVCPLCRRELGISEVMLFKQYHELIVGELENEIVSLKHDIAKAREIIDVVKGIEWKEWVKFQTLPSDLLNSAMEYSERIARFCDVSKELTAEATTAIDLLKDLMLIWTTHLESKRVAIKAAANGRLELMKRLAFMHTEVEPYEYRQAVSDRLGMLKEAQLLVEESKYWGSKLPAFAQLLKKITERAKEAHEELVVADFEFRLDAEYKALAEKGMKAFGVRLARRGIDAAVTVVPQVSGQNLDRVLSEGEQRLHALALLFAELETCPQSVLVFDDPISSLDYNYIANYCARLRDLALKYPMRQVIVLTHNWEFFVQLQSTLHRAGLDPRLSVFVLENCTFIADYSERIDDLKRDIAVILNAQGEPTRLKKEELAGKMRRLIEAVVNTHVFNKQRHQFKQKSLNISVFQSFTEVVALLPGEANKLGDLYSKLSITEHDDPRNAYVNTDKAMFQTRYDEILIVEAAVVGRK